MQLQSELVELEDLNLLVLTPIQGQLEVTQFLEQLHQLVVEVVEKLEVV
jgi:hypothetical protein